MILHMLAATNWGDVDGYKTGHKVIWSDARVVDQQTLLLHRRTNGWAKNRPTYFAVQFSRPFDDIELINEDNARYRCNGCLDHEVLERSYLTHADIMLGGKLHFVMGSVPNSTWSQDASQRPPGVKAQF